MRVLRLFVRGEPHDALSLKLDGIVGRPVDSPLRHVLLLPQATLDDFAIPAGALRENVVVDEEIHAIPSGATLSCGELRLRLTMHCEPCAKTRSFARSDVLAHRRGYLAQVVSAGVLRVGDELVVGEVQHDAVPYAFAERVAWFLAKRAEPISASRLLREIGVHRSYARALPSVLAKLGLSDRVTFATKPMV